MLRNATPCPTDLEQLLEQAIGCCIAVHRALGPGLLESIYARAVCLELSHNRVPYEHEREFPVYYRGALLCHSASIL